MNCNMLLKLSRQGAVYIRSNEKLSAFSESDNSADEELLKPALIKQEPEVLEIQSESDIEGTGNWSSGIN